MPRRNHKRIWIATLVLVLTVLVCSYFFKSDIYRIYRGYVNQVPSKMYLEPQIKKHKIHGLDVSHHQGKIDWDEIKHPDTTMRFSFVFIRASVGLDEDKKFKKNWSGAKKAGLKRGAYHYYWANVNSAKQAAIFKAQVKLSKGDLPPVLDIEDISSVQDIASLRKGLKNYIKLMESHYGCKPILYTGESYFNTYLASDTYFEDYPRLWIANYNYVKEPDVNGWDFWQYSDRIPVSGIKTLVDGNVFKGTAADFKALLLK